MSKPPAPPATFFGFSATWLAEVDSTSDEAARRLRAGTLALPAVVVADVQTRGRGTRGRTWVSTDARGSLTATFALPAHPTRPVQHLPLLAGLCVRDALADVAPAANRRLTIKWPNDVMLDGRKLAGLLCERRDGADLVGVGVNLAVEYAAMPAELAGTVAGTFEIATIGRDAILAAIAARLQAGLPLTLAARYADLRRHDFLRGRTVTMDLPFGDRVVGVCDGIGKDGTLRVHDGIARRAVSSGIVTLAASDDACDEPRPNGS